jgi:hypothetical protein
MEEFEKMAASELYELSNTEQEASGVFAAAGAGEFDETASEDEAGASAAGPEPGLEPVAGSAPEPSAESPETQNESNPSEAAPLNAESSAE